MASGPGLVFILAVFGPQDFVSNAAAGATFRYALLWTLLLVVLARYVMLEATARYVVVTGETLMTGYARSGRWVVWLILASIFVKRYLSSLAHVLLLGSSITLLLPLPTRWSNAIWASSFSLLGFALMYWGKYRMVERISKPLMAVLGGSLLVAAAFSKPDLLGIARGAVVPSVPPGYGVYGFGLVLMALAGAGAGSLSNLKYAAFVHEKGWRDTTFLKRQRIDLLFSGIGLYCMFLLVQVAAAGTLLHSGGNLRDVEDLLPMFSGILGRAGPVVLALGIWGAVFSTYVGANTGYALMVADIWHNVLRKPGLPASGPERRTYSDSPVYRWCLIWFCISPMHVLLTTWKPLSLAIFSAAIQVVLLPLIVVVLMWMTSNRRLMRNYANGWLPNIGMAFIIVAATYVTYRGAVELWGQVGTIFGT